jgi:hypothetical protein
VTRLDSREATARQSSTSQEVKREWAVCRHTTLPPTTVRPSAGPPSSRGRFLSIAADWRYFLLLCRPGYIPATLPRGGAGEPCRNIGEMCRSEAQ